eukprot:767102-Hanusia_phi.AAC.1
MPICKASTISGGEGSGWLFTEMDVHRGWFHGVELIRIIPRCESIELKKSFRAGAKFLCEIMEEKSAAANAAAAPSLPTHSSPPPPPPEPPPPSFPIMSSPD